MASLQLLDPFNQEPSAGQPYPSAWNYSTAATLVGDYFTAAYNYTDAYNYAATTAAAKAAYTRNQIPAMKYIQMGVGVTGSLGNMLVIFVIFRYTNLHRQPMTKYVINQSIIDALCSVFLTISPWLSKVHTPMIPWYWLARMYCSVWGTQMMLWATTMTSAFNLVIISLERFFAIRYPIRYREIARKQWTGTVVILSCWIFGYGYTYAIDNMRTYVDARG